MSDASNYETRFRNELINEHNKVFDENTGSLKSSVREELNKCPVCNEEKYSIYCIKDLFVHKKCKRCGLIYLDPRLNQNATIAFYNSEVNEVYNESKFHSEVESAPDDVENIKNYEILKKNVPDAKGKRLLEIGCGKGTFLARAAKDGFEVYGIELNKLLIDKLKTITPNIYENDILDIELPENYFDVIYFRDVMEHISSIQPFLKKIYQVLKPNGIVFIDTHNIDSIVNRATKEYHTVIFAFEHPVHWSPKTLSLACENARLKFHKVYFDHEHQTMSIILDHLANPSFTYIFPPKRSRMNDFLLKKLLRIIQIKYIKPLDKKIMRFLSRTMKRGSKMQVLFTKE